ncbi:phenylalanine 4-monooxygenase, partial [Salinimicrobium sp. CDJ15-91]|nr:phenylalanine 4-monooxygenase [Salinimicrobium oceani]
EREELESLYESVRNIRQGKNTKFSLDAAFDLVKKYHPKDWLLSVEIFELVSGKDEKLAPQVLEHLEDVKQRRPEVAHLIDNGLDLVKPSLVKAN